MVKLLVGRTPFSGGHDEDLEETVKIYLKCCSFCDATLMQKQKEKPIMLKGPARGYFASPASEAKTFVEAISLIRKRYNNREKSDRLLEEWQGIRLTKAMKDDTK